VCGNPTSRTIVTAASYEARPFGIKAGMPIGEALSRCPHAILVEGDLPKYTDTARDLQEMLLQFSPRVEVFSIDEAFVELRPEEDPIAVAHAFKKQLKAKLAAELKKPDGRVWIRQADIERVFENLPVSELCGIGPRVEKRLNALGVYTLGELRRVPLATLKAYFGYFWGELLSDMAHGVDDSPVVSCLWRPVVKSMGHSYTLHRDTTDMNKVRAHLLRLSLAVGRRLRADSFAGRTIRLTVRTSDFSTYCRHQTFPRWFRHGREIYQGAVSILEQLPWRGPIRMVGVSVANLIKGAHQRELFVNNDKLQALEQAEDAVLDRFGEFSVRPAALLLLQNKQREEGKWTFISAPADSHSMAGARRFIHTR